MAFADELNLMRDDCLEQLSAGRTVTLTKRVDGAFNAAAGQNAHTSQVTSTITAIRGGDQSRRQGASTIWTRVYMIDEATKLDADNAQKYTITDETLVWRVIEIRRDADGRLLSLLTERKT